MIFIIRECFAPIPGWFTAGWFKFHSCLTIMMRACKARAPDEGGMMKKLSGQNFNKLDNFCYVLFVVNEIVILSENSIPE